MFAINCAVDAAQNWEINLNIFQAIKILAQ